MAPPTAHHSFDEDFRQHFRDAYGEADGAYGEYAHAYRFGRERALESRFIGLTFDRAVEDLRAFYGMQYPGRPFGAVREAVRHGFACGHALKPLATGGLDRAAAQHAGNADEKSVQKGTSAHMAVGGPPQQGTPGP